MKDPIEIWKYFAEIKPIQRKFTVAFQDLSLIQNIHQNTQSFNNSQLYISPRMSEKFTSPLKQSVTGLRSPELNIHSRFIDQNEEEYEPEILSSQQNKNFNRADSSQDNYSSDSKFQQARQNFKVEYEKMLTKVEDQERQLVFINRKIY